MGEWIWGAKWLYSVGRQRASGTAMLQDLGMSVGVFTLISQLLLISTSVKWVCNSYRTLTFQFVPYFFPMDNTKYSTICEKYFYIQHKLKFVLCNTGFVLYNCTVLTVLPQKRELNSQMLKHLARVEQMYLCSAVPSLVQIQQCLILALFRRQCELLSSYQLFISGISIKGFSSV